MLNDGDLDGSQNLLGHGFLEGRLTVISDAPG